MTNETETSAKFEKNSSLLLEHVHVWTFSVTDAEFCILPQAEIKIADRFRFEDDRKRMLTARRGLRLLLSEYLCLIPEEISIVSKNGFKPYLDKVNTSVEFSISHSGELVVIALSSQPVGIDVEKRNDKFNYIDLLPDHFSEPEREFITTARNPTSAFYYLWTRKEALVKSVGAGLQENLKVVEVLEDQIYIIQQQAFRLASLTFLGKYEAAVAYFDSCLGVRYFNGDDLIPKT